MRIPFAIHSYQTPAKHLSAQRCLNLYFEAAPDDAKMKGMLIGTPGLTEFSDISTDPVRGMAMFQGTLCAVVGDRFYTIDSTGTATNEGGVNAGTDPVIMVGNPTQLAVLSGSSANDLYVWDGATLTAVADPDYLGAVHMAYLDGYLVAVRPNSGRFAISDLLDFTAWDALNFANAEGAPDYTIAVASVHRELWFFGETTTEIWYNSGNADFPMQRNQGGFVERGCGAPNSVVTADNSVFWLGNDGIVYRGEGYTPRRISTHAIEAAFSGYADTSSGVGWTYTERGHTFYVLSFAEATWCYDMSTGLWAERASYQLNRWRPDNSAIGFNKLLVGDHETGKIYEMSTDIYTDNGDYIEREAVTAPIHGDGRRVSFGRIDFECDFGQGLNSGQGSDPQLMLSYSDDGGYTWSNELWRSFGEMGEYGQRAYFNRLGSARSRVFKARITDPVRVGLIAFDPDA